MFFKFFFINALQVNLYSQEKYLYLDRIWKKHSELINKKFLYYKHECKGLNPGKKRIFLTLEGMEDFKSGGEEYTWNLFTILERTEFHI